MHRLDLLGAVHLVDAEGRALNSEIATKHLAVLVFVVMEGARRPVRRDTITARLWPDSEQRNARQSLSQSLHVLRGALGDVVVSGGQEELSLDRSRITCDCFEFLEHAKAGRLEDAVDVYKGEFAAGLFVKDCVEFDEWLSQQRAEWRGNLAAVLTKLFDAAVASGNLQRAADWAEKLLDVAPQQDEAVRALVPLLAERGFDGAAIRLYDRYAAVLRETFDVYPPAVLSDLIATLPGKQRAGIARRITAYVAPPAASSRTSRIKLFGIIAGAAAIVLLATRFLALLPSRVRGSSGSDATSPPKVAVTQFTTSGSAQRAAVVLNDALQWRLQEVGFDVVNAGRQDTTAIRKLAANETGNTFIIGGDVEPASDSSLVAHLWLQDAVSGKRIWQSEFTQQAPNAHLIATQLSEAVATQIRKAAGQLADVADADHVSAESWREVYRARERIAAASDMRAAGAADGSATDLADAEATLVGVANAEPDWALPWVLRGRIADARATNALIRGDVRAGSQAIERGIVMLDSVATRLNSPDVYEMRGTLLYRQWLFGIDDVAMANGTLQRADSDLRQALSLGHERSATYAARSGVMFSEGKYTEASVYARRAYDSNIFLRNSEEIITRLFNSALHEGDDAAANQWCGELQKLQPGRWPAVLCRIHLAGFAPKLVDIKTLQTEIDHLVEPPPIRQVMLPRLQAAYAISLAQVGMTDSARAILARVRDKQSDPDVLLFSAFALAELHDAPQAHALLQKYLSEYRGTRSGALYMRWLRQDQGSQYQ